MIYAIYSQFGTQCSFCLPSLVIEVEFEATEFQAPELVTKNEIHLRISQSIIVDTHFFVLAMTYEHFDDEFEALNSTYPELKPRSLKDEYDQAECKFSY